MCNLKELRQRAGYTQNQLAAKANVSPIAYQRYEYGIREPKARTAIRIAEALNTTVEKLWGGNPATK